ncbi:MAG: hypothetical protein U0075_13120 [Thermomicrobiales bacterium]
MAVTLQVEEGELVVRLDGWQRWAALKQEVRAPLASVTSASISRDGNTLKRGHRWPGSYVQGRMYAGTWKSKGATDFWMVSNPHEVLVIEFSGGPYNRWLLNVEFPEDWVRRLTPRAWE